LWAYGRFNLALSDSEFWCLTLAQFYALRECQQNREEWFDYRSAQICAVIANILPRKKGKKTFKIKDFMPGLQPPGPRPRMTDEQMEQAIISINASCGGLVKEE
jgi:hypothetical protein